MARKNVVEEIMDNEGIGDVAPPVDGGEKAKRERVTEKAYLDSAGGEVKDIREAAGIRIGVVGTGEPVTAMMADLPEKVRNACAIFGLNLVLTNAIGGKRGDEAYDDLMARWETIAGGEWTSRAGGGEAVPSMLAEAILAAYQEAGKDVTLAAVKESMAGKDADWRKNARKSPAVEKHYLRLQQERLAARAAKAGEGGGSVDDLGLGF